MLKVLRLHNFKTYLNAEFKFNDLHLIVGKNNSGKTNLCTALSFLRDTASHELDACANNVPGGINEIGNWAFDSKIIELSLVCEISVEGQLHEFSYDLHLRVDEGGQSARLGQSTLAVEKEVLRVNGPGFDDVELISNDGHEANLRHERSDELYSPKTLAPRDATMLCRLYELETNRRAISFRQYLRSWCYYALSPEAMRTGWKTTPSNAILSSRGDELATYIFRLKNIAERSYRKVIKHVQMIEPDLEAINFQPVPDQGVVPFVELRGRPAASWQGLSDGTLRALALSAIVETVTTNLFSEKSDHVAPLIIIEEPENGIFPGLLRKIMEMFEERAGLGQFLFTSHSPYFINFFDASRDSVTLLRRNNERTETVPIRSANDNDPDRLLLAEEYSAELFD